MINRKNIITILLIAGLLAVIYFSVTRTQHGDKVAWLKQHGEVANRRANPQKFCVECHTKEHQQTKENFCDKCHSINAQHKQPIAWVQNHGVEAKGLIDSRQLGSLCLDCHKPSRVEAQNQFCNACHSQRGVTPINYQQ